MKNLSNFWNRIVCYAVTKELPTSEGLETSAYILHHCGNKDPNNPNYGHHLPQLLFPEKSQTLTVISSL